MTTGLWKTDKIYISYIWKLLGMRNEATLWFRFELFWTVFLGMKNEATPNSVLNCFGDENWSNPWIRPNRHHLSLRQQWCLSVRPSVCLAGQGRGRAGLSIWQIGQCRGGYACISRPLSSSSAGQGKAGGSLVFGDLEFALPVSKTQKDLRNFWIWFSGLGISTLGPGKF